MWLDISPLTLKVESKFPHTFEHAFRIEREKEQKLSYQAFRDREGWEFVREEGMNEGQVTPIQQALPLMGSSPEENLARITRHLEHLVLNLINNPDLPRDPQNNRNQRRQNQGY